MKRIISYITDLLLATLGVLLVCAVVGCGGCDDARDAYADGLRAGKKPQMHDSFTRGYVAGRKDGYRDGLMQPKPSEDKP